METLLGLTMSAVVGILGWAINMSSRVRVAESRHDDLIKSIDEKFDDIKDRLERIESKLWNGGVK